MDTPAMLVTLIILLNYPNICMRLQNNRTYDQESRNQLVMIFVCPFEATDPDKARYCCGPKLEEYCCTYWQSKKSVSGVLEGMAVIASILLVIIVIGINLKRSFQDRCCKKEPTTTIITWDKAAVPL
ncbi:hypothetical protein EB796_008913 [Bugula neritina]|uniref:Shisa N-terminal domain-containing protein n=1 Tax=Bugula neritina TaxID=10212 RepID=A0A7J7K5B1_BUGNE|nr:hypothetical protein EB796_008913 [Bugula neritina]